MSTQLSSGMGGVEKVLFAIVLVLMVPLFLALSQPAWRGEAMVAQLKDDCAKRGGVILHHSGLLADSYECASRLNGRQSE